MSERYFGWMSGTVTGHGIETGSFLLAYGDKP